MVSTSVVSHSQSVTSDQASTNTVQPDNQNSEQAASQDKVNQLPDTGNNENNRRGLIPAIAAMLAGLGFLKRKKKDNKENKDEE
ncbi:LPXTG cell wall anchor domain-containing protein [Staphylococcus carnosus]